MARLFDNDPITKTKTLWHDTADGDIHIETKQDVTDIAAVSKDEFKQYDERARWGNAFHHKVASIPLTVLLDLQRRGIADDPVAFKKWLNDPDNRVFRTRPGRV